MKELEHTNLEEEIDQDEYERESKTQKTKREGWIALKTKNKPIHQKVWS